MVRQLNRTKGKRDSMQSSHTSTSTNSSLTLLFAGIAIAGAIALIAANSHGISSRSEIDWLSQLADSGDDGAQLQLGIAYRDGLDGLAPDAKTGRYWLRAAAEQGNAYAADALANAYASGQGGPQDPQQAEHWWKVAARSGNADAQEHLGQLLLASGETEQAMVWLRDAADRGDQPAQGELARLYREAPLPDADLHRGENRIAALGERLDSVGIRTMYTLWHTIETGSPVMQSSDALTSRAQSGDPLAEFQLAMHYRDGAWAVEADAGQAMTWLRRAADAGNRVAIKTLAESRSGNRDEQVKPPPATAALPAAPAGS
jgi:TPR repeat protein